MRQLSSRQTISEAYAAKGNAYRQVGPTSLSLPSRLPQPHAGAAAIFIDEFDAGFFEGVADRVNSPFL
jgi:hypothetical protein